MKWFIYVPNTGADYSDVEKELQTLIKNELDADAVFIDNKLTEVRSRENLIAYSIEVLTKAKDADAIFTDEISMPQIYSIESKFVEILMTSKRHFALSGDNCLHYWIPFAHLKPESKALGIFNRTGVPCNGGSGRDIMEF